MKTTQSQSAAETTSIQPPANSNNETADILKLAGDLGVNNANNQQDAGKTQSQTQVEIDFKNAELARKFSDPDDPNANLYNRKREYQRKSEKLTAEVSKLQKEIADLKKNSDVNSTLERILSIQSNPEILEFEKMTDERFTELMLNEPDKAQRYVKYLAERNAKAAEQQKKPEAKEIDNPANAELETLQKENMLSALNQGVLSIKEKFQTDITPENLQELLNKTDFSDLYAYSLLKQGQFDKVLTNDQQMAITRATLKRLEAQQSQQPPHSLMNGEAALQLKITNLMTQVHFQI